MRKPRVPYPVPFAYCPQCSTQAGASVVHGSLGAQHLNGHYWRYHKCPECRTHYWTGVSVRLKGKVDHPAIAVVRPQLTAAHIRAALAGDLDLVRTAAVTYEDDIDPDTDPPVLVDNWLIGKVWSFREPTPGVSIDRAPTPDELWAATKEEWK